MRTVLAGLAILLTAGAAAAETFPVRPIRIVNPFPPGRVTDIVGRIVADGLRAKWDQGVVVENKPGASGTIGMDIVKRARPDGYTLLVGGLGSHGIPPVMMANYPMDVNKDFTALAMVAEFVNVMVVAADFPATTLKQFVDYAAARPGQLNFGSTSIGTSNHLAAELFMLRTGTKMVNVPFGANGSAVLALQQKEAHVVFENLPSVASHVKAGGIRALAVTSDYRTDQLPGVPTARESGVADFVVTSWIGMYGPPGMPADLAKAISEAILEVVKQPEARSRLATAGFEPSTRDAADYAAFQAAELEKWRTVVKAAGLEPK